MSQSLNFWIADWRKQDSAPNDSKQSVTSVCFHVLHEWNFDSLGLFPHNFIDTYMTETDNCIVCFFSRRKLLGT